MRREIETTFGELKYAIGLNTFHARKRELIKQEIYARLILHNFCEGIIKKIEIQKKKKILLSSQFYKINSYFEGLSKN